MASLMAVASASLIIPATLYASIQDADAPKAVSYTHLTLPTIYSV